MSETALETRFLDLEEGRVAYDDTGGDEPLVLCAPGLGDLRSQFRYLRPVLTGAGFRVMTMDLRGTGDSSAGWTSYTPDDVADDMEQVLHANLSATPAVVICNSMAAASAVRLAAEFPSIVRALVLVGPVVRDHETAPEEEAGLHAAIDAMLAGPWGADVWAAYYRGLYPTWAERHQPPDLDEHIARIKRNLAEHGRLHALRAFSVAHKRQSAARVDRVHVPVLAVMGSADRDQPDPAAELDWLAKVLCAKTLLLDGIGHYPHVEAIDVTGAAILEFLHGLPSGQRRRIATRRARPDVRR